MRIGKNGTKVKGKKAAGIIFTDGKSILLLKRSGAENNPGCWSVPGGKGKDGETEIGTAMREAKEETGVGSIPGHRFDSMSVKNGHQKFTMFFYRVDRPFNCKLSKEHTDWEWIDFDKLSKIKLHPRLREELPEYLRKIRLKVGTFAEWVTLADAIQLLEE